MSDILKKSALALACGLAFSANAATVTISGGDVTASINDQGTFAGAADTGGGPALGTPGLSYKGVEFVNIDTPLSWWWLSASGVDYISKFGGVSVPLVPATTTGPTGSSGTGAVTENTTFTGLALQETYRVTGPNKVSVSVQITNNTGAALSNVKWGAGFDPDQGGSGKNTTLNQILSLGNGSAVSALDVSYGTLMKITMVNTTTAGAVSIAPYIGAAIDSVDPDIAYAAAQGVGFSTLADDTISLAYLVGTLGVGQTVTLGYDYIMVQVPEPETYAMLLAGLGLMGLIARRRRRT